MNGEGGSSSREGMEARWVPERGEKGDQGDQGEKGAPGPGLPRKQRRAIVYLFLVAVTIAGIGGYLGIHGVILANRATGVAEQTALRTRHHSALCTAITELEANKAPAGNPLTNPSRGYDQRQHAIFTQLRAGLGCQ